MKFETLRRQYDNYIHSLGKPSSAALRESSPDFFDQELPSLEDFLAAHASNP
jgi:hypothetical protein